MEEAIEQLKAQLKLAGLVLIGTGPTTGSKDAPWRWWIEGAGRFADDPAFEEMVRLGGEYRESLRRGLDEDYCI
ncbi:MAG TPA: hypothetical protein VG406_05340 [Isosphaeraceae bacterium]|nr:hypothetical protein [Isosphaeraceae bacterium]